MLSRPYQAQSSPADRGQLAAFYGMLGLFAGVVIVAVLACLYTLTQQLQNQSNAIDKLEKSISQTDQAQTTALEILLEKSEDVSSPKKFVEGYNKVKRELKTANEAVQEKGIVTGLALAENKRLTAEIDELKKTSAKLAEKLKTEEDRYVENRAKLDSVRKELDTVYETPAGQMSLKYSTALYAAITGWIVAVLSSLGLLAIWIARTPLDGDAPPPRPGSITVPIAGVPPMSNPTAAEEPPHQIL